MIANHTTADSIATEASLRLAEFRKERAEGTLTVEAATRLAFGAVSNFMAYCCGAKEYLRDAITLLCEMTALKDQDLSKPGLAALFPALVERLNDSFEPESCALYDRVFAQVIDFNRRLPDGETLEAGLRRFELASEQEILARKAGLRQQRQKSAAELRVIKKVMVLSRVTIGADVAVTSVTLARLRQSLPDAELVLLGPRKLGQLFGGEAWVRIREAPYEREGDVLSRLKSWLEVLKAVDDEQRGLRPGEMWVIDPDSRLTQLGLLPLVGEESSYSFFESRSYRRPGAERLSQLTESWLNELIGAGGQVFPFVALPQEYRAFGQELCRKLRRGGASYLVSMSLGVGGNTRKQLPGLFEEGLIHSLLNDGSLILDKGAGEDERERVNRLIKVMRSQGKVVVEVDERNAAVFRAEGITADIITWDGGIGAFAGLIAGSDEYIGYDSAGQHIAAALGVPTLTVFVNSNSPLFARRWHPYGPGAIKVLNLDRANLAGGAEDLSDILAKALALHRSLRDQRRTPVRIDHSSE